MTLTQALKELESIGDEKVRAQNARNGAPDKQYGVKLGDIRSVAKKIKSDHDLALALWKTGNFDARLLATLIVKPKQLSAVEMEQWVADAGTMQLAEWVGSYVLKQHPEKEKLRARWMSAPTPAAPKGTSAKASTGADREPLRTKANGKAMLARAGWSLTAARINKKDMDGLDPSALLDRIEKEMPTADPAPQWTMNNTLAAIGINLEKHRKRALTIGEKLGVYRDYPVSKGCTSPFAPAWINEMVKRQGDA